MTRVITSQEAINNNVSAQSLERVADWNTRMAEKAKTSKERERHLAQAKQLLEVAETIEDID